MGGVSVAPYRTKLGTKVAPVPTTQAPCTVEPPAKGGGEGVRVPERQGPVDVSSSVSSPPKSPLSPLEEA